MGNEVKFTLLYTILNRRSYSLKKQYIILTIIMII